MKLIVAETVSCPLSLEADVGIVENGRRLSSTPFITLAYREREAFVTDPFNSESCGNRGLDLKGSVTTANRSHSIACRIY